MSGQAPSSTDVASIIQALQAVYNPQTEKTLRSLAQKYLDSLQGKPESISVGYHLAHINQGLDLQTRHYGLLLMKSAAMYHWTSDAIGDGGREQLKSLSLDLLCNGLGNIHSEKQFMVENVSRLVVEVAKRVWPLQWIDLDSQLQLAYNKSAVAHEAVVNVLRLLAEDVFVYDNPIAELRKPELTSALMAITASANSLESYKTLAERQNGFLGQGDANLNSTNFEIVMDMIRGHPDNKGWLNRWSEEMQQIASQSESDEISARLLFGLIKSVAVFMEWTPLKIVIESKIVYVLIRLLESSHGEIRSETIQALTALVSRNLSPMDENRRPAIWEPFFDNNGIQQFIQLWIQLHSVSKPFDLQQQVNINPFDESNNDGGNNNSATNNSSNEDEDGLETGEDMDDDNYKLVKKIAQLMVSLGENQVVYRRSNETPQNFSYYLTFMASLFSHEGLMIPSMAVSFWSELLRHEYFQNLQECDDCLSPLLNILYSKISHIQKNIDAVTKYEANEKSSKQNNDGGFNGSSESLGIDDDDNNDTDFEMPYFDELDFDSTTEFREFAITTRQRLLEVVRSIASLKPLESFNWIVNQIQKPINQLLSKTFKEYNITAFSLFAETVIMASSRVALSEGLGEYLMPLATNVLQSLISVQFDTSFGLTNKLVLLNSFTRIVQFDPQTLLMPTLESIFAIVTFTEGEEANNDLVNGANGIHFKDSTRKIRRKATSSLMVYAKAMPQVLALMYQDISSGIMSLIQSNKITTNEKSLLLEFLLVIACFSKLDFETKKNYFNSIVTPSIQELETITEQIIDNDKFFNNILGLPFIISNASQLKQINDLETLNNNGNQEQQQVYNNLSELKRIRSRIVAIISAVYVFTKRTLENKFTKEEVIKLWEPFAPRISLNLLKIIKRLHWLWTPEFKQSLTEDICPILLPTYAEKAELSGVSQQNVGPSFGITSIAATPFTPGLPDMNGLPGIGGACMSSFDSQLELISKWLSSMRNMSYLTLTQLTSLGVQLYSITGFIPQLSESLFDDAQHIQIRHWSRLIATVMNKLIANCPPQMEAGLLNLLLPPFFNFVREKLDSEWDVLTKNNPLLVLTQSQADLVDLDNIAFNMENSRDSIVLSEELLHEKLVRDMTRAYSNLFIALLTTYNANDYNVGNVASMMQQQPASSTQVTQLQRFFNDADTATALVRSVSRLIQYKDSTAARRTLLVIPNIISSLPIETNTEYVSGASVLLLQSLLEALRDPYHRDLQGTISNLITEIYLKLDSNGINSGRELFRSLDDVDDKKFFEFEKDLHDKQTPKAQVAVVRTFLDKLTGVAISQLGKREVSRNTNDGKEERQLLQRPITRRDSGLDYVLDSDAGSVGISELFEED